MKKLPEEAAFEPERMPTSMSMQEGIDMSERTKALEPCPFCGCTEINTYSPTCRKNDEYDAERRAFPIAKCGSCYAEVWGSDWDQSATQETAVAAWNTRNLSDQEPQDSGLVGEFQILADFINDRCAKDSVADDMKQDMAAEKALQAIGAALRSRQAGGGELLEEIDPVEQLAEYIWKVHVPEAKDWVWGQDVSRSYAEKYRAIAKSVLKREFIAHTLAKITSHMEASDDES